MAMAAKNVTLLATEVATSVTRTSMSLASELWAGIDLINSTVNASGARFCLLKGTSRAVFDSSELGAALQCLPVRRQATLWAAIQGVDIRFPRFAAADQLFHPNDDYGILSMKYD